MRNRRFSASSSRELPSMANDFAPNEDDVVSEIEWTEQLVDASPEKVLKKRGRKAKGAEVVEEPQAIAANIPSNSRASGRFVQGHTVASPSSRAAPPPQISDIASSSKGFSSNIPQRNQWDK